MRDIKFRAWDKKKNGWVSRNEWLGGALSPSIDTISVCSVWQHFNIEIMQYTGLKDKNGVEIYEGDILKISNISVLRCEFKNGCFVLIHSKEFAGADNLLWGNLGRLYDTNMNDIFELTEVIGNIYENTELLETT